MLLKLHFYFYLKCLRPKLTQLFPDIITSNSYCALQWYILFDYLYFKKYSKVIENIWPCCLTILFFFIHKIPFFSIINLSSPPTISTDLHSARSSMSSTFALKGQRAGQCAVGASNCDKNFLMHWVFSVCVSTYFSLFILSHAWIFPKLLACL